MPVMIDAFMESVKLLANVANVFVDKLLVGLEVNDDRCKALIDQSLMMVTSLAPVIGYEQSAAMAKEAFKVGQDDSRAVPRKENPARSRAQRRTRSLEDDRTARIKFASAATPN